MIRVPVGMPAQWLNRPGFDGGSRESPGVRTARSSRRLEECRLQCRPMGFFNRKAKGFPPTPFGYQPPEDADVRSWACADPSCDSGEHAPDPRTWPKACPRCGSQVVSGVIAGRYAHDAERYELDYRLRSPNDEIDLSIAQRQDIVWRYKEAARRRDAVAARQVRAELEAAMEQAGSKSMEYMDRASVQHAALSNGLVEEAAEHLARWYSVAPIGDHSNGGLVANVRMLATSTIDFLEDPAGASSSAAPGLWDSLKRLMSLSNDISSADMNMGFARLRQRLP